jgi:hypothetical protein
MFKIKENDIMCVVCTTLIFHIVPKMHCLLICNITFIDLFERTNTIFRTKTYAINEKQFMLVNGTILFNALIFKNKKDEY